MSEPIVDKEALLKIVDNDPEFLDLLLQTFLDDCSTYMQKIRTAVEAKNAEALAREAHGLKGAVANLQAKPAQKAAHQLEELGRSGSWDDAPIALEELEEKIERLTTVLERIRHDEKT